MNQPQIKAALQRINALPVDGITKDTKIRSVYRQSGSKWLLGIPLLFSRKLNVWDPQKGRHVYTSVSKSDWKKIKKAASNQNAPANLSSKSLELRKKLALEIIRKTDDAKNLSVLDRASPQQVCQIARQLARYGHNTAYRESIFKELRQAQSQWQALSMDPQTLHMVDQYVNGEKKFGSSSAPTVKFAPTDDPRSEVDKLPGIIDVNKEIEKQSAESLRKFVADLISVDERDRDQSGDQPQRLERLRQVFSKHRKTALFLSSSFASQSIPDLAKSCGVQESLIQTIRSVELQLSGKIAGPGYYNGDIVPGGSFENLADELDDSIAQYKRFELPKVGEHLAKNIPQREGNFGNFLNEVFLQYFQNMENNDVRAVMASGLREAKLDDPAERHLVATLKGSGPYMLKILQLMGDSVDASSDDGVKLKKALGELKDQLLPIAPDIQTSMLRELVDNSNPRITSIVDVKPLGAASVGQTFLAKLNFELGSQQSVVIKLLKPGVDQRAARERTWMDTIARKHPGIQETFAGIADQIDRELDLSREAVNVGKAKVYRQAGLATLQSVRNVSSMEATQEHMFMELAPGKTVKAQLDDMKAVVNRLATTITDPSDLDIEARLAYQDTYQDARGLSDRLHELAGVWLKEALFGSGFYHGDLHGGNMMYEAQGDNSPLTLIDFGNASTLSRTERADILKLIMASEFKYPEVFVDTLTRLLGPQSQALLSTPETKGKLIDQVTRLCQDNTLTGAKRMLEAINLANTLDVAVPNVVSNFARSQNMLEMAIQDVNGLLKASHDALTIDEHPPENPIVPKTLAETLKTTLLNSKKQILLLTSREGWAMRNQNPVFDNENPLLKPEHQLEA